MYLVFVFVLSAFNFNYKIIAKPGEL